MQETRSISQGTTCKRGSARCESYSILGERQEAKGTRQEARSKWSSAESKKAGYTEINGDRQDREDTRQEIFCAGRDSHKAQIKKSSGYLPPCFFEKVFSENARTRRIASIT
jgi:hypothetical protein